MASAFVSPISTEVTVGASTVSDMAVCPTLSNPKPRQSHMRRRRHSAARREFVAAVLNDDDGRMGLSTMGKAGSVRPTPLLVEEFHADFEMPDRMGPERPKRHAVKRSSNDERGLPDLASQGRLAPFALRVVMFLVTALAAGLGYRSLGGDPGLVALVSTLAGLGGVGAVEFADRMGLL